MHRNKFAIVVFMPCVDFLKNVISWDTCNSWLNYLSLASFEMICLFIFDNLETN
jgi:hypothetical protein